jgi:hypothetical protein
MLLAAAAVTAVMAPQPAARANVITFQNGSPNAYTSSYTGTQDTQLFGYSGVMDWNSGTYPALAAGNMDASQPRVAIIRFDGLDALAGQYSTITSAKLTLAQYSSYSGGAASTISVYPISDLNAGWTQGTTYLDEPADGEHGATWNDLDYPDTGWAGTAGLSTPTTDYDSAKQDFAAVNWAGDSDGTIHTWDLSPILINHWITDVNAGLLIKIDDPTSSWAFYSSEGSPVANRPILEIHYTPVPEPTTGALLLIGGGLVAMRRRRRN